jgi:hypothetical protein
MFNKFLSYIQFWKKQPHADSSSSFNLRMMHGINRLSILMFLLAVIFMAIKYLVF